MKLDALLDQPAALPSLPKTVHQLIASLAQEDVRIGDIATQLESDPVLAAKTLRLANSAYFLAPRPVSTVANALQMLGLAMIRNLVLGSSFSKAFGHVKGLDLVRFWRHSACTAAAARWLAMQSGQDHPDDAFMLGLMHGLGHLVLHAGDPETMQVLNAKCDWLDATRAQVETEALGYHHGTVGAALARRWRFPEPLPHAIEAMQEDALDAALPMLPIVRLASWVSAEAWGSGAPCEERGAQTRQALERMGVSLSRPRDVTVVTVRSRQGEVVMPGATELLGGIELLLAP